jgi:hypothetical protein
MAERLFGNQLLSNVRAPVEIFVSWVVGAVGAVGAIRGNKVTSVVRNGAGLYTITLDDRYNQLYNCACNIAAISGAAEDIYPQVAAYNSAPAATGATVQIECMTGNVQTDPAATDEVFVKLVFSNSSLDA